MPTMIDGLVRRFEVADNGCWLWTGTLNHGGYGVFSHGERHRTRLAHRLIYEEVIDDIPPGYEMDHLCFNPACVNPDHLEVVTRSTNQQRRRYSRYGIDAAIAAAAKKKRARTACKNGHPYTPETTFDRGDALVCRRCAVEATQRWRKRSE